MDTPPQVAWHYEALPPETKAALDLLSNQAWLKESTWYLAGGTALALQSGHRTSYDLDFFTQEKTFSEQSLLKQLSQQPTWMTTTEEPSTIYGELAGAKVSFITYPFFVPKQEPRWHGSIRILHPIDIAVMKLIALSQRGKKRDFFDAYWCAHHLEPLEETIKRLKIQYPSVAHDYHHILKSLVYFADAEDDPEPDIHFRADWSTVKDFFTIEVPTIAGRLIR